MYIISIITYKIFQTMFYFEHQTSIHNYINEYLLTEVAFKTILQEMLPRND